MSILSAMGEFARNYSLGILSAAASVGFAGYMVVHGGGGAEIARSTLVVSHVAVESPLKAHPEQRLTPARQVTVARALSREDRLITGSLRSDGEGRPPAELPHPSEAAAPPVDYVLRFATPDVALVEGSGRLWSVGKGDLLPGAGRVVDIEHRARDRWVVKTYDGKRIQEISSQ